MSSSHASSARPPGPLRRLSSARSPVAPAELAALARRVHREYAALPGRQAAALTRRAMALTETLDALPQKAHPALLWADDVARALTSALVIAERLRKQMQPSVYRSLVVRCLPLATLASSSQDAQTLRSIAHTCTDWLSAFAAINDPASLRADAEIPTDSSVTTEFAALPRLHERYVPIHVHTLDQVKTCLLRCAAGESEAGGVLCISGPRGVGKSLLVNALAHAQEVMDAFADGVSWIQDGPAVSDADFYRDVFRAASAATSESGAEVLATAGNMPALVLAAEKNDIQAKRCLLVLDGVCGARGAERLATLVELLGAQRRGSGAALVLTTNEDPESLCSHRTQVFRVEPLEPLCDEAGAVFDSWAGLFSQHEKYNVSARGRIVHACGGLPVALAIAGAALYKSGHSWDHEVAAFDASARGGPLVGCDGELAVEMLLDWIMLQRGRQFVSQLSALAVLPAGVWIPVSALSCLWKLDHLKTRGVVRRFQRLGLSTTEKRHTTDQGLCPHPCVREYSTMLLAGSVPSALFEQRLNGLHRVMVEEYARRTDLRQKESNTRCRSWWNLKDDDYIYSHLAWHMVEGGLAGELCDLLCEFRWISRRIFASGIVGVRADYELVLNSSSNFPERRGMIALLKLFRGMTRRRLTESQLASVLCAHLALPGPADCSSDPVAFGLLRSVNREAKRPWLRPMQQLLGRKESKESIVEARGEACSQTSFVAKIAVLEGNTKAIVASVDVDGCVHTWFLNSDGYFKLVLELKCDESPSESGFSAVAITRAERLVTGSVDGAVQVWSLRRSRLVALITRHSATITALATDELRPLARNADCMISIVVSGCTDGSLYISDLETLEFARMLEGHTEEVTALCILPRQRRVVSASFDGFATIWSIDDDDRVSLNGHKERVTQLCALDRGNQVASSCLSGHAYIWCSSTGACLWSKEVGFEFVSGMALQRYAMASYRDMKSLNSSRSKMNLCPYFCVRGADLDELSIVSAIDCECVMASCIFDAPVTALGEVWAFDAKGKHTVFVLAGLQTGQVLSVELVTTFASRTRPKFRLD